MASTGSRSPWTTSVRATPRSRCWPPRCPSTSRSRPASPSVRAAAPERPSPPPPPSPAPLGPPGSPRGSRAARWPHSSATSGYGTARATGWGGRWPRSRTSGGAASRFHPCTTSSVPGARSSGAPPDLPCSLRHRSAPTVSTTMESLQLLSRSRAQFESRLAAVRGEDLGRPTPCPGWDVATLVAHVINGDRMAIALLDGASVEESLSGLRPVGPDDDAVELFAAVGTELDQRFAQPGALERVVHHPVGDVPGGMLLGFRAGDRTHHAWDLARAPVQDETLDSDVVAGLWAIAVPNADRLKASGMFGEGASGNVGEDAALQVRLLDLVGRRPWETRSVSSARDRGALQLGDDRVRDLRRAHGGGVVAVRLHVVGDAFPLGDDRRDRRLETVAGVLLADVTEHQHAAEHHGHGVGDVLARVLGGAAVRRLEHRDVVADVGARSESEATDQPCAEVAEDVAVEVGHHHHVVQLGLLHQLHGHVVDDALLELDLRKLLGHLLGDAEPEPVGVLHDVGLVHRGHLVAPVVDRPLEREPEDALAGADADRLDADPRVRADGALAETADGLYQLEGRGLALGELDARVEVLGVLANDHQVDVAVAAAHAGVRLAGPHQGEQIQIATQRHVDAAEALADSCGQRALDRHPVLADRLEHVVGHGLAELRDDVEAGILDIPLDVDTGRVDHAARRLADLVPDAVARDQRDGVARHCVSLRVR